MGDIRLEPDEFDVLIEALGAWVLKDQAGELIAEIVTAVLPDERRPTAEQTMVDIRAKHEADKKLRGERAILIQAKLIQMRDHLVVEHFAEKTGSAK